MSENDEPIITAEPLTGTIQTNAAPPARRASIDDLEKMLEREPDATLEILPNGEIREYSEEEKAEIRSQRKPLTLRENLGGEYGGRKHPRRIGSIGRTPHQVMAIAAALATSSPGGIDGSVVYGPRPPEPSDAQKWAWALQYQQEVERLAADRHERRLYRLRRKLGARAFKRHMVALPVSFSEYESHLRHVICATFGIPARLLYNPI
jgi:hypothetical protein